MRDRFPTSTDILSEQVRNADHNSHSLCTAAKCVRPLTIGVCSSLWVFITVMQVSSTEGLKWQGWRRSGSGETYEIGLKNALRFSHDLPNVQVQKCNVRTGLRDA